MTDISLSKATRSNLLSLQRTTNLIGRTQERLASGRKVNTPLDDALAFFKARSLNTRASELAVVKDGDPGRRSDGSHPQADEGVSAIRYFLSREFYPRQDG